MDHPIPPVPASEAWLWDSPLLRESMERALRQATNGEFVDLGSFARFVEETD